MIKKYPNNIESWLSLLSNLEIPILKHTHDQIIKHQQNIDNIDLRDLSILIRHDPLLSLKLLKHQEKKRSFNQTTDITTIEKVLLMIGIKGFFNSFGGTQHIEDTIGQNEAAIEDCHKTCYRAYFASQLADSMGKYRRDLDPNEIVTAALLHETAEILLWQIAPELMINLKQKLSNNRELRSKDIQNETFGCNFNELQQRLCSIWNLPKILTHLANEDCADEPRVKLVKLATSIARHTEWSIYTDFYLKDLSNTANFLKIDEDEAHRLVVSTAVYTAKHWDWFGVQPTAARLIS